MADLYSSFYCEISDSSMTLYLLKCGMLWSAFTFYYQHTKSGQDIQLVSWATFCAKHTITSTCTFSNCKFSFWRWFLHFNTYLYVLIRWSIYNDYYFRFMMIPFVFELRAIMDWMWTDTSMSLMEWLKMEDIFSQLFQLKVYFWYLIPLHYYYYNFHHYSWSF